MESNKTPETTLEQFAKFAQEFATKPSAETQLTWGYEIESNTMANVKANAEDMDIPAITYAVDWQSDGSVSDESDYAGNEECECECGECYHDCGCDNCDLNNGNQSLDHDCGSSECYGGSSDCQEVASIGAVTDTHPESLTNLAKWKLNDATFNSDCGIHIHIGSAHLTAPQVANVMTAYRLAKPVLDQIAERADIYYAMPHTPEQENATRSGERNHSKYQAVNVANHFQTYRANTIEFRQMAGTTQTDIPQTDRVRAWGEILRQLVAYATKPAPSLYWLSRATDLNDLLRLMKA
jgi:hypothetical protein